MHGSRRHIGWTFARRIGRGRAAACQRHLAVENDMRGIDRMRMVWIRRVRAVLPDVDMAEAFLP